MPFRDPVGKGRPTLLQHAEYAIVDTDAPGLRVSLERVAVDASAVRASLRGAGDPMAPWLLAAWAWTRRRSGSSGMAERRWDLRPEPGRRGRTGAGFGP